MVFKYFKQSLYQIGPIISISAFVVSLFKVPLMNAMLDDEFIEEDTLNPTHLPTVKDQTNYFVSRDTKPQDIGFSGSFNTIDSTYSNVQYKKVKDVLLRDIKNKICNFVQNKINKKTEFTQPKSVRNPSR